MVILKRIFLLTVILISLHSCDYFDPELRKLRQKDMFTKSPSFFIGRPVKEIILRSKFRLVNYSFAEASAPFFLNGLYLTFSNDVKILVRIDEFKYVKKRGDGKLWDINQCILERASGIEFLTDKPVHYQTFQQKVSIDFVSADSIIIRDDLFDHYRKKAGT